MIEQTGQDGAGCVVMAKPDESAKLRNGIMTCWGWAIFFIFLPRNQNAKPLAAQSELQSTGDKIVHS